MSGGGSFQLAVLEICRPSPLVATSEFASMSADLPRRQPPVWSELKYGACGTLLFENESISLKLEPQSISHVQG